jgi:hypothetical protein
MMITPQCGYDDYAPWGYEYFAPLWLVVFINKANLTAGKLIFHLISSLGFKQQR